MRTAMAVIALAASAASGRQPQAPFNPYLELYDPRDWTLRVTVDVRAWQEQDPSTQLPVTEKIAFDTAAIVFPLLKRTAASVTDDRGITSEVRLNDRETNAAPELLPDYHSGARLGKWALVDWTGDEVALEVSIPMTCWKTRFDEAAASRVGWPKGDWPAEAASTFDPQFFVDLGLDGPYDMSPIKEFVDRATRGKDPKTVPPVTLAKFLAGEVQSAIQPSGNGLGYNRIGQLEGIDLQGAPETMHRRRGSEFDMVCALAAVYREAGLPTRIVIGYDIGKTKDEDRKNFLRRSSSSDLRAWVEFALLDEGSGQLQWIPVDVLRMRERSPRPPAADKPWEYFGTHDELDGIVPFAFQFHPPTTVRAYGSPGFWGWLITPRPPERALQALSFVATTTPKRGQQPEPEPEPRGRRNRP